jgi:hypothetical protein
MGFWAIFGGWVAAGLTLFIFSFLYKDNPFYKFAEHLYVGISVGYGVILEIYNAIIPKWYDPLTEGKLLVMIPAILGIFVVLRIFPKLAWLSRLSFAFLMGYGAGLAIPRVITSYLLRQVEGTVKPIVQMKEGAVDLTASGVFNDFTVLLIFFGVLCVLIYFFFSVEHKGVLGGLSKLGIIFLMIWLGATYGSTVMGRLSLVCGRFTDLYMYGSKHFYYATPAIIIILIVGLILFALTEKKSAE